MADGFPASNPADAELARSLISATWRGGAGWGVTTTGRYRGGAGTRGPRKRDGEDENSRDVRRRCSLENDGREVSQQRLS